MARELPTGIEWPRYEDGGFLEIGDIVPVCGKYEELLQVHLGLNAFSLYTETCDEEHMYGQRIKRVVLSADWEPIKEGDEVLMKYNARKGVVRGFDDGFAIVEYDARDVNGGTMTVMTKGACLTRVMTDSWERIEEDAANLDKMPCSFTAKSLVRRCKWLAERGR